MQSERPSRWRGSSTLWAIYTSPYTRLNCSPLSIPQGDRGGNEICMRMTAEGQPKDLHRFWDGVITSSSNLTRLRNEATALRNRQEFQRSQLTELASTENQSHRQQRFIRNCARSTL